MSKHYCYEYKKRPRVKKEFKFGDLCFPINVGWETSIDLLDSINQVDDNQIEVLKRIKEIIMYVFGDNYDDFVKEFEKDGDKMELEDFEELSKIVVASLRNIEPDKVDDFFQL